MGSTSPNSARSITFAAILYFSMVFSLGFALGALRSLLVRDEPGADRLLGVVIEIPIMLVASWYACRYTVRRFVVAPTVGARAAMGGIAFALLQLAEVIAGALLFGRTPIGHFALYADASYALGLAAQVGFALMPTMQLRPGA